MFNGQVFVASGTDLIRLADRPECLSEVEKARAARYLSISRTQTRLWRGEYFFAGLWRHIWA
jgi:hypothetical protein